MDTSDEERERERDESDTERERERESERVWNERQIEDGEKRLISIYEFLSPETKERERGGERGKREIDGKREEKMKNKKKKRGWFFGCCSGPPASDSD